MSSWFIIQTYLWRIWKNHMKTISIISNYNFSKEPFVYLYKNILPTYAIADTEKCVKHALNLVSLFLLYASGKNWRFCSEDWSFGRALPQSCSQSRSHARLEMLETLEKLTKCETVSFVRMRMTDNNANGSTNRADIGMRTIIIILPGTMNLEAH